MNNKCRLFSVICALALVFAIGLGCPADTAKAAGSNLFTVSKVAVDVRAEDAVAAKKKAHKQARRSALRTVLKRLVSFSAYDHLPSANDSMIDDLLINFSVRKESNSRTRYLATLDFEFNPDTVRQWLSAHQLTFSDIQAPRLTVLPVYLVDGKVDSTGNNRWRQAWTALDLEHAVTPVKLAGHGSALDAETVNAILTGDQGLFGELLKTHKTETFLLAVAEKVLGGSEVTTKLYGIDSAGSLALTRVERVFQDRTEDALNRAAVVALAVLEGRWKLTQTVPEKGSPGAARHSVLLTVEFASLKQWHDIRGRLARVAGVQALEVTSLSARSANVTFRFPGGAPALAGKLPAQNLALSNNGGAWILRATR